MSAQRDAAIRASFDGTNIAALSRQWCLSPRRVFQILAAPEGSGAPEQAPMPLSTEEIYAVVRLVQAQRRAEANRRELLAANVAAAVDGWAAQQLASKDGILALVKGRSIGRSLRLLRARRSEAKARQVGRQLGLSAQVLARKGLL